MTGNSRQALLWVWVVLLVVQVDALKAGDKEDPVSSNLVAQEGEDDPLARKYEQMIQESEALLEEILARAAKGKEEPVYKTWQAHVNLLKKELNELKTKRAAEPPDDTGASDPLVRSYEQSIRAGEAVMKEIERRAVKGKNDPTYRVWAARVKELKEKLKERKKKRGVEKEVNLQESTRLAHAALFLASRQG